MAIGEGEVAEAAGSVEYAEVTSCLTITCLIDDAAQTHVGAHASLQQKEGKLDSVAVLDKLVSTVAGRKVVAVKLAGQLDRWSPKFLTDKPSMDKDGDSNYDVQPELESCESVVAEKLGVSKAMPVSETVNGTFTVTLKALKTVTHSTLVSEGWKDEMADKIEDGTEIHLEEAVGDPDGVWYQVVEIPSDKTYTIGRRTV